MENDHYEEEEDVDSPKKNTNALPLWGNEKTMNMNTLLLTNIQSSHYFKVNLFELKTYHEVIDEIYYKVTHLEPWEKGSRKTGGQTGMCGGVRGVGVGGIVSTAFSCLYKLFTLRLTRKQVNGLLNHTDSPYLRGLGFMYLRYTQPPADLWGWFEPYLEDEEMIDVKAGGGEEITIGLLLRKMLTKLDWYGTLFPRIPVPIQMKLQKMMQERFPAPGGGPQAGDRGRREPAAAPADRVPARVRDSPARDRNRAPERDIADEIAMEKERIRRERETTSSSREKRARDGHDRDTSRDRDREKARGSRDRERERRSSRDRERERRSSRDRERRGSRDRRGSRERERAKRSSRDRDRRGSRDKDRDRDRERRDGKSRDRHRSRSRDRHRSRSRDRREGRERREGRHRSRSRSHERRRHRSREHRHRSRSRDQERR